MNTNEIVFPFNSNRILKVYTLYFSTYLIEIQFLECKLLLWILAEKTQLLLAMIPEIALKYLRPWSSMLRIDFLNKTLYTFSLKSLIEKKKNLHAD